MGLNCNEAMDRGPGQEDKLAAIPMIPDDDRSERTSHDGFQTVILT